MDGWLAACQRADGPKPEVSRTFDESGLLPANETCRYNRYLPSKEVYFVDQPSFHHDETSFPENAALVPTSVRNSHETDRG
jgi:hypothetical protein